jgi:hypothetical protein
MSHDDSTFEPLSSLKDSARAKSVRFRLPDTAAFRDTQEKEQAQKLRDYLKTSLQMQHLTLLCGSGTSTEAGGPSMSELWKETTNLANFDLVLRAISSESGSDIEEFLSRCDALLELTPDNKSVSEARAKTVRMILTRCRNVGTDPSSLQPHQDLLKKVARRRARDSRVKVFTSNYDLCFERAAAELGIVPIDGFSFGNPKRFDPRFFDFDIVKRTSSSEEVTFVSGVFQYFKLHGSVDWSDRNGRIEVHQDVSPEDACLIYPARAKFQRSYQQPHLELMARYLAALREHNTCLVVVGFGFIDAHLYAPIFAALRSNPHFRLVVVSRTVDRKLESPNSDSPYFELRELAERSDVALVAASFNDFVSIIPDLAALSPAHDLEAAVLRVTGKSG